MCFASDDERLSVLRGLVRQVPSLESEPNMGIEFSAGWASRPWDSACAVSRLLWLRDGDSGARTLGDFPMENLLKLRRIDIATGDDADGSTRPRFPGQSGSNGNATSAFHDNPMPLEQVPDGVRNVSQRENNRAR